MKKNWPVLTGVFLVSLSILALEVIINRMFALTFWYHFAFIILSIALFGIGLGGLLVYFTNRFVKKIVPAVLALFSVALAFVIPYVMQRINEIPLEMNQIASDVIQQNYFRDFFTLLVIPFFLAGYIFSSVFSNYKEDINMIYFFDLLGGGIGCFFALLLFPHNGPLVTSTILTIIVLAAAVLFAFKQHWIASIPVALLIIVAFFTVLPTAKDVEVRVSTDKRSMEALGKRIFQDWDNFGFVAVHEKTNGSLVVTADYSCFTYLYHVWDNRDFSSFKTTMKAHYYPFVLQKKPEDVGIVGVGGGKDVLLALGSGAKNVYGAEFNSTIYRVFSEIFDKQTGGVAHFTNVHIKFEEGRFFIRSSPRKYDVLIFDNSISQVAVTSGSFTLAESYLFTVEAMVDYINHLKPGGVIYLSNPYTDAPRFASLIREAFRRLDRESEAALSVLAVEEDSAYRKCKFLIKNGKVTRDESAAFVNYTASLNHNLLYTPYDKLKTQVERILQTVDLKREYALSDTDIRPSTDDWPFFTQHVKPTSEEFTKGVYAVKSFYPQPFILLRQITAQVAFYSLLFLILPLIFLNIGGLRKLNNKFGSLVFFASLGLGFMLLEVVMMQKYALILGHPTYAFAVVLSTLLISSGIGSFFCERFKNPFQAIFTALIGIIATTVVTFIILKVFSGQIIGLSLLLRCLIVIAMVFTTGFFMGFMMPSGIRAISGVESSIPWMWSINGVFSVVASFLAVILSILFGYTFVFIVGLSVYIIGTCLFVFQLKLRQNA